MARAVGAGCREPVRRARAGRFARLIGRQEEMGLLLRAWDGSRQAAARSCSSRGRPGRQVPPGGRTAEATGKDRIWVAIRGSPFHTASAFHPIIEHLKHVFGWQPDDTARSSSRSSKPARRLQALPLSQSVPLFADLISVPCPRTVSAPSMTAQQQRDATLDAIVAWLSKSRRHPGADGMGGPALGRSDHVGNAGHADRAGADGGDARVATSGRN